MALLEFQDVHFSFDDRHPVLAGVSFQIEAGRTLALVGPNGAGKTTLLRLAGGLLTPTAGRVLLDGRDLRSVSRRTAARRMAGLPAEEQAVFPFTVREIVGLGRHPWRGPFAPLSEIERGQVDAALEATALTELAERSLPGLSSGERQRAGVARCLVQDTPLLLLDEPTSHQDLGQRLRLLHLLRSEVRTRDKAVILVLHDLNLASLAADELLLLVDGRVREKGTPSEVLTAEIIEAAFDAPVEILAHPGEGPPAVVLRDDEPEPEADA